MIYSKSRKPLKMLYVQRGEGLSGRCVMGLYRSKAPRETSQNIINNNSGKRWSVREGKEKGRDAMYDMCMCANFYQYHKKKHEFAAPAVGIGVGGRAGIGWSHFQADWDLTGMRAL